MRPAFDAPECVPHSMRRNETGATDKAAVARCGYFFFEYIAE
jgi:hypothetical protein